MRIYLAGPMRGYPDLNRAAFDQASADLRREHAVVFSPAEHGDQTSVRECFRMDTEWICLHADAVALLPGWETSKGALAEKALAEALGLQLIIL